VIARIYLFVYVTYVCAAFYKNKKERERGKEKKKRERDIVSKTEIDI
jgi:hypothetical protein